MNFSAHRKLTALAIGQLPNKPPIHHHDIVTVYVHEQLCVFQTFSA